MTNEIYNDLLNDGFTWEEVEEIVMMIICGHTLDSAIQSILER